MAWAVPSVPHRQRTLQRNKGYALLVVDICHFRIFSVYSFFLRVLRVVLSYFSIVKRHHVQGNL